MLKKVIRAQLKLKINKFLQPIDIYHLGYDIIYQVKNKDILSKNVNYCIFEAYNNSKHLREICFNYQINMLELNLDELFGSVGNPNLFIDRLKSLGDNDLLELSEIVYRFSKKMEKLNEKFLTLNIHDYPENIESYNNYKFDIEKYLNENKNHPIFTMNYKFDKIKKNLSIKSFNFNKTILAFNFQNLESVFKHILKKKFNLEFISFTKSVNYHYSTFLKRIMDEAISSAPLCFKFSKKSDPIFIRGRSKVFIYKEDHYYESEIINLYSLDDLDPNDITKIQNKIKDFNKSEIFLNK